jgi:hypothetical protein
MSIRPHVLRRACAPTGSYMREQQQCHLDSLNPLNKESCPPPACNGEKVTTYVSAFGPSAENDQMRRLSDPHRFTHMPN